MEIRQFEAFAAVHASGSVTAAARQLDRSQPVVSRQIQDLEQELGFTLFARTRPQVTLTEQGRQFLEEVRNVLAGLQQLEMRSREISEGRNRPLRVVSSLSLGTGLMPDLLADLEASGHRFEHKLQLDLLPAADIVDALVEGVADVAITSLPLNIGRCRLQWSAQAPCMVALPEHHPLAALPEVSASQFLEETVITPSNASGMRHRMATALLHPARPPYARQIISNATSASLLMVKAGLGVALVDPCAAAQVQMAGVVYRPLDNYIPYSFGVVTHGERPSSDEAQHFVDAAREFVFRRIPNIVEGDESGIPLAVDPQDTDTQPDLVPPPPVEPGCAGEAVT